MTRLSRIGGSLRSFGGLLSNMGASSGFDPLSLFAANEVGGQYEPWDLSTLYKDSSGTIPATVNDVVGLMLDKSKGLVLGPEKVINGTFNTDISGWNAENIAATAVWNDGKITVTSNPANFYGYYQAVSVDVGRFYKISVSVDSGRIQVSQGLNNNHYVQGDITGTKTYIVLATTTALYLRLKKTSGDLVSTWDDISVKELPGHHAFQSITASKPILRQDANGFYYLEHDGLDDYMVTGNVFTIQNDSFMALAYSYNISASSSPFSVFGVFKDSTNYISLYQRPASAHIFSAGIRGGSFGLVPVTPAGTTGSSAPNTPLVTHARLNTDIIYVGKNHDAEISAPFALGANKLTAAPLKINSGLVIDLRFYGGLYRQKDLTPTERANVISYFAQHAGIVI